MLNWLANAIATRIQMADRAAVQQLINDLVAEREEQRKSTRALIHEVEDVLEKFSRVVAREGMRRSRAAKAALEAAAVEDQPPPAPAVVDQAPPPAMSIQDRKRQLRQQFFARQAPPRRAGGDDE